MQRLGKNHDGYHGETIDIDEVLAGCLTAAKSFGWQSELRELSPQLHFYTLRRGGEGSASGPRIYISTGIHGDEPAGPLAVRALLEQNNWPANASLWLCPCLNPSGFGSNRRENAEGVDLNRDYQRFEAAETRAHVAWLQRQPPFDLALCLHEDWEANGFYLYELNPDDRPSLGGAIIDAVHQVCPIDTAGEIEGRPASGGIIKPSADPLSRPLWPEAFWLLQHQTRLSYTLEAPSDYPLTTRVSALVTAVQAALQQLTK